MNTISSNTLIRINKYICQSGVCSRKAADIHVANGRVSINGRQAMLGDKVTAGDEVLVNGQIVKPLGPDDTIFIMLNKPVGIVCTAAKTDRRNIVDFVNHSERIYPVGRLDKNSQGLIFLTNQCGLVDKILHTDNQHEKQYNVTVNKPITDEFIEGMSGGVPMLGETTRPCRLARKSQYVFTITLVQGLNRQIRRMCKHFTYKVERLERVRIMHITSAGLPAGQWRDLTPSEMKTLYRALDISPIEKTAEY